MSRQVYANTAAWWNIKPRPKDKRRISVNKHSTTKGLHFMNIKSDTLNPTSLVLGGPSLDSYHSTGIYSQVHVSL